MLDGLSNLPITHLTSIWHHAFQTNAIKFLMFRFFFFFALYINTFYVVQNNKLIVSFILPECIQVQVLQL